MSQNDRWWHPNGEPEPNDWDTEKMEVESAWAETTDRFHIGQSYEKEPAKVIECRTCAGRKFEVGCGSYFTAIRCVNCRWECCIHSG